jgi:hypothetical protein
VGIRADQRAGQVDSAVSRCPILLILLADLLEMGLEGLDKEGRQDRHAIVLALPIAHGDSLIPMYL